MISEARIVDMKTQCVEVFSNGICSGLLPVHAESEGFNSTEEEERIDGGEGVSNSIDSKCHVLVKPETFKA